MTKHNTVQPAKKLPVRKCQWCGCAFESDHPSKLFCTTAHKNEFGNYMASRGKVLMPIALAWRTSRGRRGVGADALKEMVRFLDQCAAELTAQKAQPMADHFRKVRGSGTGITLASDAPRHRPSRA